MNATYTASGTDYDRDGKYTGERESRTPIGEVYDSPVAALNRAFEGEVAFAAATIHRPKLLILDEPLLGIDPAGQRLLKDQLVEMARGGCCILVSTHQLDTAERLCTKVSIINHGRNVATGDLEGLRRQAHAGEHQTLEEIFLKLTDEAGMPEPEMPRRKGLFSRRVS